MYVFFKKILNKIINKETSIREEPFGKTQVASKEYYLSIFKKASSKNFNEIDKFEKEQSFNIDKYWIDNLALHTQIVKKKSEINYQHGRVLYALLSNYLKDYKNKNENILIFETGTARGFSSVCMSKAINDIRIIGTIITLDVLPHNKKIYWNCIDDWEGKKSRAELLNKWPDELKNIIFIQGQNRSTLKNLGINRINFAFLDAQHTKNDVLNEFYFVKDRQNKNDIIIFDDVDDTNPEVLEVVHSRQVTKFYDLKIINVEPGRAYAIAYKK